MFSFRKDKVGFFSGLTLIIVCVGTFIATLVLLIVGAALGDWSTFIVPIKGILAGWWLACIATVLTRVYIYRWQMIQRARQAAVVPSSANVEPAALNGTHALPLDIVLAAEVERARADAERYRAIRGIGVAALLGDGLALAIVSMLAGGVPDRPGSLPVLIVAWSVGGGVMLLTLILCVIALWRRDPKPLTKSESSGEALI